MVLRSAAVAAGLCLGLVGSAANASPITYLDSGVGSGSLGVLTFTNQQFTVSFVTDSTTTTYDASSQVYQNTVGDAFVTIDGIGTAIFLGPSKVYANNPGLIAGIMVNGSDVLGTISSMFANYRLGPTRPVSGASSTDPGQSYLTTLGLLEIDSVSSGSTFSTSPVPLPASAPMFGAAIVALGAAGYAAKRRRTLAA